MAGPFGGLWVATDFACNGGVVVAVVLGLLEVVEEERFEGALQVRSCTARILRDAWPAEVELQHHRVFVVEDEDGEKREYRIGPIREASGEGDGVVLQVEAEGPEVDLALKDSLIREVSGGVVNFMPKARGTLAAILASHILPRAPSSFVAGTIGPTAVVEVPFQTDTPMGGLLRAVALVNESTDAGAEVGIRRNGAVDHRVDIGTIGGTAVVPDVRTGKNLQGIVRASSTREQRNRLTPFATNGGGPGVNHWKVSAVSTDAYIEVQDLDGGLGPAREHDQWNNAYWVDKANTPHQITDTIVIDAATTRFLMASTSGIALDDRGSLAADGSGTQLAHVDSPSSIAQYGALMGTLPTNLPDNGQNGARNGDLATWASGLPAYFTNSVPGSWVEDTGVSLTGGRSARYTAAGWLRQAWQEYLIAGETYTYSIWYRYTGNHSGMDFTAMDPDSGTEPSLTLSNATETRNQWIRVDRAFPVTVTGLRNLAVGLIGGTVTAGLFYIDSFQGYRGGVVPFRTGSHGARLIQRANRRHDTHRLPLVAYEGRFLDLAAADPAAWPYDQLVHGGTVNVEDTDLAETFAVRAVRITRSRLEGAAGTRVALATTPSTLATLLAGS